MFPTMLTLTLRTPFKTVGRCLSSSLAHLKEHIDPIQNAALNEKCFVVTPEDKVIAHATKRDCHLVQPDGSITLHRAFSVFLFNKAGDLLLQKRSDSKVTYPEHYTNSCCSHPIADIPGEGEEDDALGVKRAAQRRLNHELGIPFEELPLESFNYLTRVHYMDTGNGVWGEHEIDYILFLQGNFKLKPNSNEISAFSFVPRKELDAYLPTLDGPLTPWFKLILQSRLKLWWDNLDELDQFREHNKILKFGKCASCA